MSNITTVEGIVSGKDKIDFKVVANELVSKIDFDRNYLITLAWIAFNPIFWNIVARTEYKTKFLTKFTGSAKKGCYLLAVTIFSLGIGRDLMFERSLRSQQTSLLLANEFMEGIGYMIFCLGQILVLSSMWGLGITGTYLGDYFGILMNERVTSFPFTVSNNPMYHGSTLTFLGTSIIFGKPAGLLVSLFVYIMYAIALRFEEPFTAQIYAKRDEKKSKKQI